MLQIKNEDIVEVLPGCVFQSLVYSKGVVIQSLNSQLAIVRFQQKKHYQCVDKLEVYNCTDWIILFDKLKVLDSPQDSRMGILEEEILGLEDDLVTARALLHVSEEMREHQFDLIEKLVEDVDKLKAELYHLKGN